MISCRDVSPNLKNHTVYFHSHSKTPARPNPQHVRSLLSERLLLVDANVEVHRLHPQQHAALDLTGQRFEHGPRQRDADVEAIPVPRDDRQHLGGGVASCLGDLKVYKNMQI